jgi:hypothetical protein
MKKWKVIIELEGKEVELITEARYYSDAFVNAETQYPGCRVKSITEIKPLEE